MADECMCECGNPDRGLFVWRGDPEWASCVQCDGRVRPLTENERTFFDGGVEELGCACGHLPSEHAGGRVCTHKLDDENAGFYGVCPCVRDEPLTGSVGLSVRSDQAHILAIVSDHGPLPPSEVARHLLTDDEWARARLRTLEHRGLVAADYTASGYRARAYSITAQGSAALVNHEFGGWDD